MIKGEHAYGKTVSKAKLQGQSVSDGIPGEERHAKTLLEEGRRQGREESARLLQIEREENARLLQKEQEKSAQLLQKEQEKAPSFRRNGICTSSLSASCCFRFSN